MKTSRDPAVADRPLDPTGRDGAIDFAAHDAAAHGYVGHAFGRSEQFAHLFGTAVVELWSELPRDVQELLFERAVALGQRDGRDDSLREQLAKFLHDHHPRTAR